MKYLIQETKEQEENELLYDIAEFLWNNGNKVFIINCNSEIDNQNIVKDSDSIVLLSSRDCSVESHFERDLKMLHIDYDLEKTYNQKLILFFSKDGVYSNAFPFPHKIFNFEKLDQNELTRFFNWCRKLNLFAKNS